MDATAIPNVCTVASIRSTSEVPIVAKGNEMLKISIKKNRSNLITRTVTLFFNALNNIEPEIDARGDTHK
jgi:hypothetical protein